MKAQDAPTLKGEEIAERKDELSEQIGEDADGISTVQLNIQQMRRRGVLVDVDIHGLGLLRTRASWAELGIPEGDVRRKRLRRGSKDLFPEHARKFRSLDARFRQSLERHSFVLEGFKPFSWVPFTAYEDWKQQWAQRQDQWEVVKADLLDQYEEIVDAESAIAAEIAREAWDALTARHRAKARANGANSGDPVAVIIGQNAFEDVDQFVDYVVRRAVSRIPSKNALNAGLYVDYRTAMVLSGADVESESLRQEHLQTAREQELAKQHAARAEARTREDEEWAKQQQFQLEVEEQERLTQIRLEAEEKRLQTMHEAEMEHARQQLAEMVSPFQDVLDQLRSQIHLDVAEIAASIQKHGHLRGKVAERARHLVETFHLLNAHGDEELEQALGELRGHLVKQPAAGKGKGKKSIYDTQAVLQQLKTIKDITHQASVEVARRAATPTRARALEF